jgi:hypothetical protein
MIRRQQWVHKFLHGGGADYAREINRSDYPELESELSCCPLYKGKRIITSVPETYSGFRVIEPPYALITA